MRSSTGRARRGSMQVAAVAAANLFLLPAVHAQPGETAVADNWMVLSTSHPPAGTQESITYKTFELRWLWTSSLHLSKYGAPLHVINTTTNTQSIGGWEYTWRSYAGHVETPGQYGPVVGLHWAYDNGVVQYLATTLHVAQSLPGIPGESLGGLPQAAPDTRPES